MIPGPEAQPFPCPSCGGGGVIRQERCLSCGGSGYGPLPHRDDMIARLIQWAHRALPTTKEN